MRKALPLALLATLAACKLDGGQLVKPGIPTGTIIVVNRSADPINAVTISDCDAFSHGLDRLGEGDVIYPGDQRAFRVSAGCYDVVAGYGWGTGYAITDGWRLDLLPGQVAQYTVQ